MLTPIPAPSPSAESRLVRAVGMWGLAAGIVNVTIGAGIFRLPSGVAAALGPAAPVAYLACAIAMAVIVLCFAEAGSRVSLTGGLYAYVEVAFGPAVGFMIGVLLWAGLTAAMGAVASFFADSLAALAPVLGATVLRWTVIILTLGGLAVVNVRGVRVANGFNAAITVAKLLPVALFIAVGLFSLHATNLVWANAPTVSSVSGASAVLIFAFLGVEGALVPSGEVRDPVRTVPRAIGIAIVAVTVVYLCVQLVAQSALGPLLAQSRTPVADAAGVILGRWGRTFILVGMSISMFGYLSGVTLAIPRMLFAFARDGFLPARLAVVHDRYRTPAVAILVQSLIATVLAVSGTWETLAYIANGAILVVYAVSCVATLQLRRQGVTAGDIPFVIPGGAAVPVLALCAVLWILWGVPPLELVAVFAVGLVAGLIYVATRRSRLARVAA